MSCTIKSVENVLEAISTFIYTVYIKLFIDRSNNLNYVIELKVLNVWQLQYEHLRLLINRLHQHLATILPVLNFKVVVAQKCCTESLGIFELWF